MAWFILFCAGILETVWAFYMKKSDGFTLLVPSIITVLTMIASFALLAVAMKSLPLGTAYAVWTGIGTAGAVVAGIAFLGEQATAARLVAVASILFGIVLLKLCDGK
ncbi:multidrug efflux SMR transporter [Thioclava sp. GXIMD4215]|uniref:DMT family transporter n=1 Tax=Thioclava sp. GXIMD4215 TaxID=3131928 RepID=UPI00311B2529